MTIQKLITDIGGASSPGRPVSRRAAATEPENAQEAVLSAIEKKYAGKSFEASFYQISKLAALDITEKASGKASFSHPGKMKWEYQEPEQHEIITNGKSLWIYRPGENQVMQGEASSFFKAGAGGAFLSDITLVRKNYIITIKDITDEYTELDLAAKNETPDISLIVIRVSKKPETSPGLSPAIPMETPPCLNSMISGLHPLILPGLNSPRPRAPMWLT
nr:outer membrane lipoprotein carrier protein LolA [Desulfobacula sp.]